MKQFNCPQLGKNNLKISWKKTKIFTQSCPSQTPIFFWFWKQLDLLPLIGKLLLHDTILCHHILTTNSTLLSKVHTSLFCLKKQESWAHHPKNNIELLVCFAGWLEWLGIPKCSLFCRKKGCKRANGVQGKYTFFPPKSTVLANSGNQRTAKYKENKPVPSTSCPKWIKTHRKRNFMFLLQAAKNWYIFLFLPATCLGNGVVLVFELNVSIYVLFRCVRKIHF